LKVNSSCFGFYSIRKKVSGNIESVAFPAFLLSLLSLLSLTLPVLRDSIDVGGVNGVKECVNGVNLSHPGQ
jgi:hypothetical protein